MVPTRKSRIRLGDTSQTLITLNKQRHPVFWHTILARDKKQQLVLFISIGINVIKPNGNNITISGFFILIRPKQLTYAPIKQEPFSWDLSESVNLLRCY